jgi:hypothetical protein
MKKIVLGVCCALLLAAEAPAQLAIGGAGFGAVGGGFSGSPGFGSGFFNAGFGFPGFAAFNGFGFSPFFFPFNRFAFRPIQGRTTFINQFPFGFPFGFAPGFAGAFAFPFPIDGGFYAPYYGYPGYAMPPAGPTVIVVGAPFGMAAEQPYRPPRPAKPVTTVVNPANLPPAPAPPTGPPPRFSIALTNHTVDSADAAWVQNGALYYFSGVGPQKCVPLSQVDRAATERLNAQKGLTLWLPPVG